VAAGQSSGRGGVAWRAREKARGKGLGQRPAWGRHVGAARGRRGASGGAARRPMAAVLRGRGGAEEEEGGARG
jgi:hypothetical protein